MATTAANHRTTLFETVQARGQGLPGQRSRQSPREGHRLQPGLDALGAAVEGPQQDQHLPRGGQDPVVRAVVAAISEDKWAVYDADTLYMVSKTRKTSVGSQTMGQIFRKNLQTHETGVDMT